ncbi:zinc finger protein 808-like isoform X2 [Oppia nitens]|nr:zinc finger protein 808-like isoform X2 [Oppia nitens]
MVSLKGIDEYICHICKQCFKKQKQLKTHQNLKHTVEIITNDNENSNLTNQLTSSLTTGTSDQSESDEQLLIRQTINRINQSVRGCGSCQMFYIYKIFSAHMRNDHQIGSFAPYICYWEGCYQSYQTDIELNKHRKTHPNNGCNRFECQIGRCGHVLATHTELVKHMRANHSMFISYICNYCPEMTMRCPLIERHMTVHHLKFPCPQRGCEKKFTTEEGLIHHTVLDHLNSYASYRRDRDMQLKIPAPVHLVEVPETNNNSSVQMAPEIEFCCHFDDCGQYFGDMNELSKHYCEDHYNPSITSNINNNTITTITSNSLPIPQSVPSRDPRSRPAILAKDIVLQQQEMCFRCDAPGCGQQFRQKVDFYRHKYRIVLMASDLICCVEAVFSSWTSLSSLKIWSKPLI